MNEYVIDTQYAARNLFVILYQEKKFLTEFLNLYKKMRRAERETFRNIKGAGSTPDEMFELYSYHTAGETFKTEAKLLISTRDTRIMSLGVIAGSILQIAKQGISAVHGSLSHCPDGRMIGNEPLKNIIWHGRNQAMHFEEGKYKSQTISCFRNLEATYGTKFKLDRKNLAFAVIEILGWKTHEDYETDMISLLP